MAHEILGDRFMGRAKPAWHNLGTVFGENTEMLASDAARQIAGGLNIRTAPIFYRSEAGVMIPVDKHQAVVRGPISDDPKEKVFGITTERWHPANYIDLAGALDELSRKYKVETCGLIQDGSLMFLSLRGPNFSIKGDEMKDYFICNLSNQPGNSHKVLASPVRVVCFNTNLMADKQSLISLRVPHSADAKERIKLAADLVARFKEMTGKMRATFELFADTPISKEGLEAITKAAFPDPRMPAELRLLQTAVSNSQEAGALKEALGEKFNRILEAQEKHDKAKERTTELRGTVKARFETFDPPRLRGTVWAAYNSVTEVADWREGRNADEASVWGGRAREKAHAFTAALALVN